MDQLIDQFHDDPIVSRRIGVPERRTFTWDNVGRYLVPTILAFVLTCCVSLVAWAMGLGRADVANETQTKAVFEQTKQLRIDVDGKVGKDEFRQFTKDLDKRLNIIQRNTELLSARVGNVAFRPARGVRRTFRNRHTSTTPRTCYRAVYA